MASNIFLNDEPYYPSERDLPCLIVYRKEEGGSQLSISLIADLLLQGSKILFLSAYPSAKDEFLKQTEISKDKIICVKNEDEIEQATNFQGIILKSGGADLFAGAMETLPDFSERVIFLKNIETFNNDIIDAALALDKVILSGDIDQCVLKKQISGKNYQTIIAFSQPEIPMPINVPKLEKYFGYYWSKNTEGLIRL